jgi:hypothetical protein
MRIFTFLTTTLFALVYFLAPTGTYAEATSTPILFNQNLRVGSVSPDVIRLQKFLNAHDFTVATSGPGSVGNETVRYGTLTQKAVALFQTKYSDKILKPQGLTKATGNFLKATRDVVNQILIEESKPKIIQSFGSRPVNTSSASSASVSSGTTYTATITSASHVDVSPNSVQTVYAGSTVTYTVTAHTGYTRNDAVGGTCATGSWVGNEYTTGVINAHCTIRFSATINTYSVTVSGGGDLSISPSSVSTVAYGGVKKYGVTSPSGAVQSTVGGTCPTGSWARNVYSTGPITGDCTVTFASTSHLGGGGGGGAATISAANHLYFKQESGSTYYSTNQSDWTSVGWPISIVNTDVGNSFLYVTFVTDFTIDSTDQYFIANSDDIEFQGTSSGAGSPTVIVVNNVTNYLGLLQNGTNSTPGYSNVRIRDIFVHAIDSTLADGAGWIAQSYYAGSVYSSGSDGDIPMNGGGLIGAYAQGSSVTNSYTTGSIGSNAGGIIGAYSTNVSVNTSYTTGSIGTNAGGLIGAYSDSADVSASYSTGVIGTFAGGIVGASSADANVVNVYSTGVIGNGAGGVIGSNSTSAFVAYAYTSGNSVGGNGIYADNNTDGSSNYSEANNTSGGWSDTRAQATLASYNSVWAPESINSPYLLRNGNRNPHTTPSQTIVKGNTSSVNVYANYYACSILLIDNASPSSVPGITIHSDTGAITVSDSTPNGVYDVLIKCEAPFNTYTVLVHPVTVTD